MMIPKTYPAVGCCIYCGTLAYSSGEPSKRLGDEHIIPLAFGGSLLLPEASCQRCEAVTSAIETHCIEQMIRDNREHLGLKARRHRKDRKHLPVTVDRGWGNETLRVSSDQHPGLLRAFAFEPPRLIFGERDADGDFAGKLALKPLVPDIRARIDQIGGTVQFVRRGEFSALTYGRMLAKIAHSYAVAELGPRKFKPMLLDLILGRYGLHPSQLVGGEWGSHEPDTPGSELHEITVKLFSGLRDYYVVQIRLFSKLDMPRYLVVVGET